MEQKFLKLFIIEIYFIYKQQLTSIDQDIFKKNFKFPNYEKIKPKMTILSIIKLFTSTLLFSGTQALIY